MSACARARALRYPRLLALPLRRYTDTARPPEEALLLDCAAPAWPRGVPGEVVVLVGRPGERAALAVCGHLATIDEQVQQAGLRRLLVGHIGPGGRLERKGAQRGSG